MNIPNLPTDNLYKFLALSGTIIVLLTYYYSQTSLTEVEDKVFEVEKSIKIYKVNKTSLQQKAKELKEYVKKIENDKSNNKKSIISIKKSLKDLNEAYHHLRIEAVKIESSFDYVKILHKRSKSLVWQSVISVSIGFLMAIYGYILWYRKVQKPLDLTLEYEANKHKSNN